MKKSNKKPAPSEMTEADLDQALTPLDPIPAAAVPDAGGTDIAIYDARHRGIRSKAVEEGVYGGASLAATILFIALASSVAFPAAMLLSMLAFTGGVFSLWKGVEFTMSCRQLMGHDARLYLPAGLTEADARFENQARNDIDTWNGESSWWEINAGDVRYRYRAWKAETFNLETLEPGWTPDKAFREFAVIQHGLSKKGLSKDEVAELKDLRERWLKRTFRREKLEDGLTPAQAQIEYEVFRQEASAIESVRERLGVQRDKLMAGLERLSQRALAAPAREAKLLPAYSDDPEDD